MATGISSVSARRSRSSLNADDNAGALSRRQFGFVAAAIAILYLWVPSVYPTFVSPNELSRILLTRAVIEDGTFSIDRGVARQGEEWSDLARFEGRYYSDKAPGLSLLAAPVHAALLAFGSAGWSDVRVIYFCRLLTVTLPALVFLVWRVRRARSGGEASVWLALGVGSLLFTQALSFTGHLLAGIALLLVFESWSAGEASAVKGAVGGALAGMAIAFDYLAALPLAVLLVFALFRRAPARLWLARTAGFAVPIAGLLAYHWVCFGGPFELAYSHMVVAAHQANRARGFFGAALPDGSTLVALLFGGERGLFVHAPLLLGAVGGLAAGMRERASRAEALALASLCALLLFFNASLSDWQGGWGVGPRYLTLAAPFLAWALARWHSLLSPRLALVAAAAAGWGAALHLLAVATFPLAPFGAALRFPTLEVASYLATRGLVAWNLGWLFGLHGLASVAPVGLAALLLAFLRLDRRQFLSLLAGAMLVAIAAIGLAASRGAAAERELATFPARAGYSTTPAY